MDSRKRVHGCSSLAHAPRRDGSAPLDAIASMSSSSSQLLVIKGASTPKTPLTSKVRQHQRCIDVKENARNKEGLMSFLRRPAFLPGSNPLNLAVARLVCVYSLVLFVPARFLLVVSLTCSCSKCTALFPQKGHHLCSVACSN